eukprot:4627922-Prymnesium_polylepis.1
MRRELRRGARRTTGRHLPSNGTDGAAGATGAVADAADPADAAGGETAAVQAVFGEDVWLVDQLLARRRVVRGSRSEVQFKVRWQGYGAADDSWVADRDIFDRALVTRYVAEHGEAEEAIESGTSGDPASRPGFAVDVEDCGECKYCLDKPKFGGRGTLRKKCIEK